MDLFTGSPTASGRLLPATKGRNRFFATSRDWQKPADAFEKVGLGRSSLFQSSKNARFGRCCVKTKAVQFPERLRFQRRQRSFVGRNRKETFSTESAQGGHSDRIQSRPTRMTKAIRLAGRLDHRLKDAYLRTGLPQAANRVWELLWGSKVHDLKAYM